MWQEETIIGMRQSVSKLKGRVAFVPTMGALHEGHLSLMRGAMELADHVVVSIFVNPTQFGPNEDYARYPRTLGVDLEKCASVGVSGVFLPSVDEMYPEAVPSCEVNVPMVASGLEGEKRPDHFGGVCRVVAKLLNIVGADVACFGQKDLQQLRVVQAMAADLMMTTEIVGLPTLREADGLAMSSRNVYLKGDERKRAVGLYKALEMGRMMIEEDGVADPREVEDAMAGVMRAYHLEVNYAAVRHVRTLGELDVIEVGAGGGVALLVAGKLGDVSLIDNLVLDVK